MTDGIDEPTVQAQAIMERVLALVRECRLVLRALEHPPKTGESTSAARRLASPHCATPWDCRARRSTGGGPLRRRGRPLLVSAGLPGRP